MSGSCRKEVEAFCLGVEPGERRMANCLQHQLDQEALPGLQPGENKWWGPPQLTGPGAAWPDWQVPHLTQGVVRVAPALPHTTVTGM
jgi:hypothetical protein